MTGGTGRILLISVFIFQKVNYWQRSALGGQHSTTWKRLGSTGCAWGVSSLTHASHPQNGRGLYLWYSPTSIEHFRAQCQVRKPFPRCPSLKKLRKGRRSKTATGWFRLHSVFSYSPFPIPALSRKMG